MKGQAEEQTNGQMNRWTDRKTNGEMDRQTDRRTNMDWQTGIQRD